MMLSHIRRNDEVNLTHCGKLTDYDAVITDAPIAVGKDVAVFDDVENPPNTEGCQDCWACYTLSFCLLS